MTAMELAERANISRGLLYRIEAGEPSCSIDVVFEIACILGISFFQSDYEKLIRENRIAQDKLTLLPSRIRSSTIKLDDGF